MVLGALGALAFAVENGHQSWSALYLQDALHAGPATAAAGPAVFAAVMAVTRLAASDLSTRYPAAVLVLGASTAAAGTALVGAAPTVAVGLLGLGLAAAGTAVLFPTLLGVLTDGVPDHARGKATCDRHQRGLSRGSSPGRCTSDAGPTRPAYPARCSPSPLLPPSLPYSPQQACTTSRWAALARAPA